VAKKRERTERRAHERDLRKQVRDRERLAGLLPGGSAERPITIDSPAVIEIRVRAMPCPQCAGELRLDEHTAPSSGLREAKATCTQCHVSRSLWFRLGSSEPN